MFYDLYKDGSVQSLDDEIYVFTEWMLREQSVIARSHIAGGKNGKELIEEILEVVEFENEQLEHMEKDHQKKFIGMIPVTFNMIGGLLISASVPIFSVILEKLYEHYKSPSDEWFEMVYTSDIYEFFQNS